VKLNQRAFSTVEALLIVIIIAIVGGTGYYVYNANKNVSDTYSAASQNVKHTSDKNTDKTLQTYIGKLGKVSFTYPANWIVQYNTSKADPNVAPDELLAITSPGGTRLSYSFSQYDNDKTVEEPDDFFGCGHGSICGVDDIHSVTPIDTGKTFGTMYIVEVRSQHSAEDLSTDGYEIHLYKPFDSKNLVQTGLDDGLSFQMRNYSTVNANKDSYTISATLPVRLKTQSAEQVFSSPEAKAVVAIFKSFKTL
jgi:uncharacterized protein (UPF0333 family)